MSPVGMERITLTDYYRGRTCHLGWSILFDQAVLNELVDGALVKAAHGTSITSVEDQLQVEIWNEKTGCWEDLAKDAYLVSATGVVHLLRRKGVKDCQDFDATRRMINMSSVSTTYAGHWWFYNAPVTPYWVHKRRPRLGASL